MGASGEATRLEALSRLQQIDPNGTWTDAACDADGLDRCTLAEAQEALARFAVAA
jgi:hypothetical protein